MEVWEEGRIWEDMGRGEPGGVTERWEDTENGTRGEGDYREVREEEGMGGRD